PRRPPTRPPRFPYTTLFRSAPAMAAAPTGAGPQTAIAAADLDGRLASSDTDLVTEPDISSPRKGGKRSRGDSRVDVMSSQSGSADRKSTRLNSSHSQISYAD